MIDPYDVFRQDIPDINSTFAILKSALEKHISTPLQTLPLDFHDFSLDDAITFLTQSVEEMKTSESNCLLFSQTIDTTIAVLMDSLKLVTKIKKQCTKDTAAIVEFKNTLLTLLKEKEKIRYDQELEKNAFRKAQITLEYKKRENSINEKLENSFLQQQSAFSEDYIQTIANPFNEEEKLFDSEIGKNENSDSQNVKFDNFEFQSKELSKHVKTNTPQNLEKLEDLKYEGNKIQVLQDDELLVESLVSSIDEIDEKANTNINNNKTNNYTIKPFKPIRSKLTTSRREKSVSIIPENEEESASESDDKISLLNKVANIATNSSDSDSEKYSTYIKKKNARQKLLKRTSTEPSKPTALQSDETKNTKSKKIVKKRRTSNGQLPATSATEEAARRLAEKYKKLEIPNLGFGTDRRTFSVSDEHETVQTKTSENDEGNETNERLPEVLSERRNDISDAEIIGFEEKAQLFAWSGRSVGNLVYDSVELPTVFCSAIFTRKIVQARGFVIVIIAEENVFGVVVTGRVKNDLLFTTDENCFIFVLKENGIKRRRKYLIKKECKDQAFWLGKASRAKYFQVGNGDLIVFLRTTDSKLVCKYKMKSFDYGKDNGLFGKSFEKTKEETENGLLVDRFLVYNLENV
ncbi:hypothetical protein EIN_038660 [Entamoeba invadens IP1]|uniref:TLDc domain-containing protein n=1 Tax=Entamoeba invadens IP1 TaxID=370355 RepID=L7FNM8_ENTIV|nr:hypothetical protein EIN_038660 [Entamoeba invadens IP1]ELP94676.1 hypothetical protein EIN_038660 [Entamoeba invadens IP1]|eukprot:XP_004261447.1 hypothetical protein EIN_038660 [Entamoeba invadens IP1]